MTVVKVVVSGPTGAGTTTLIRTLSDIAVLTTQRAITTPGPDGDVTVPLDFGRMTIEEGIDVQLFGAPGAEQFDVVADVVGDGLLGFVILFDPNRPDTGDEATAALGWLRDRGGIPVTVVATHVEDEDAARTEQRVRHALRLPADVPVTTADPRRTDDARRALLGLFYAARARGASGRGAVDGRG